MGLPGAGKSTLACMLCRERRWLRVDRDAIRARLFPQGRAAAAEKRAANAQVWRAVARALSRRRSVVVDGMTFARRAERLRAHRLARRQGARCVEVFVDCPPALARARIAGSAAHPAPDRRPELVDAVARRFESVSRRALRLDGRRSARGLLRALRAELDR